MHWLVSMVSLNPGVQETWTAFVERMLLPRETKSDEGEDNNCEQDQARVEAKTTPLSTAFLALFIPSVLRAHSLPKLRVVHTWSLATSKAYHSELYSLFDRCVSSHLWQGWCSLRQ